MQPIVLFSIYQNNTLTIRRLVDETIDPATQRIMLKIAGFFIYFLMNIHEIRIPAFFSLYFNIAAAL